MQLLKKVSSRLTSRQLVLLSAMGLVGAGAIVAFALDETRIGAIGVVLMLLIQFLTTLQMRRRQEQAVRALSSAVAAVRSEVSADEFSSEKLLKRTEFNQRRIIAAIESSRLENEDRHRELLERS